jgi:pimeloyl-ACP methyl ester carboxylesterase
MTSLWIKIFSGLVMVVLLWAFLAPHILQFRKDDDAARKEFAQAGVNLVTGNFNSGNYNLHYAMTGVDTLPTLVFIHGSPGSWHSYAKYLKDKELQKKFRMISVDRPGFGHSDYGKAKNIYDQAKQLVQFLQEYKNNAPLYLVGHSLGGPLVVEIASLQPDLIKGIVVIAGSVDPDLEPTESWRYLMARFPFYYLFPGSFLPSNTELLFFKEDIKTLSRSFQEIKCDAYLLHGTDDWFVPVKNVDYANDKLINARTKKTILYPNEGHMIIWTRFEEIKKLFLEL